MNDRIQDYHIRAEGESFDLSVYDTYTNLFTIQCHYYGRFNDAPKKEYIEGEICFVDMIDREDFKDDILNSIMQSLSLGYEMDDEHKVMHVYVELVEKDEEHDSDSDSDSDSESENEIVDEEHVVDEVEVNMNNFKFQIDEEDESSGNDDIVPNVNVREDNLEVLDFDSLESDLEDVPENARSLGLRKLKKKHSSSKFFIGREFANMDLAKDLIRYHAVESRRNFHFLRNDKRRIRVVCNSVVPSKNVIINKVQGTVVDIFGKGKLVNEDAEEDKSGRPYNSNFTFITDRQKGLLPALAKLFPSAKYTNMQQLKDFNKKAYEWLHKIPPEHWSRAYFSGRAHCDLLINNVCEVFNRQLLDARDSPIITTLEFVRLKMLPLGAVEWNGSELYQVKGSHPEQYVVNLTQKTYSCRKWEISGIPCKHAIAVIHDMTDNGFDVGIPEDWVHDSYKLQTWMNVYSHKVNPVNGRDMWSKFDCPTTLLPPKVHPQIGRPPKKRKKSKGEIVMVKGNKLTRQGKTVTCSLCQAAGHNKRSCSSVASQRNKSVPKKTTGTKRTSSVTGTSIADAEVGTQVPKKTIGRKRTSNVTGTSIAAAEVGTQASQAGTQAFTRSRLQKNKEDCK
ncbi:mutator type transposase [Tanacetum coccineum]